VSWHPNDLVSDVDLKDYESTILDQFGVTTWRQRRTKALEDWLFPILKGQGYDPFRLRTRADADKVFGFTASVYTDVTGKTKDTTTDDLNLATTFATPSTDAIYIGSAQPFRGLFVAMLDTVSAIAATLTVRYWDGSWKALQVADYTQQVSGTAFSGSGSITWTMPVDWTRRAVSTSDLLYWAKLTTSATPTAAKAGQVSVIRSSVFRAPVTFRTLQLIFQEAPTSADGPWKEKSQYYKEEADQALQRALQICGGEFDTDGSDQISADEATQTPEEVGNGPLVLERM